MIKRQETYPSFGKVIFLFFSIVLSSLSHAQTQYELDNEISFVYINGTSTLHNWMVNVEKIEGTLIATGTTDHFTKINRAKVIFPVISMKSGKSLMDENLRKALLSSKYPFINYVLKWHTINDGAITVKGDLTVAGVTKEIKTTVMQEGVGNHIKIKGNIKLKMTDFNVQPPEFLMGAFKTGDELTISFYFMFCKQGFHNSK